MKSWKSILTELLGCVVILSTSLMAVASRDTISAGMAGLSISYSLQVSTKIWLLFSKFETKTTVKRQIFIVFYQAGTLTFFNIESLKQHCLNVEMTLNTFDFVIDPTLISGAYQLCYISSYLRNKSDCKCIACLGILTLSLAYASIIAHFYLPNRWQE